MARDYNINISVNGGNRRGAFGGGNLVRSRGTLNSSMYKNQDNGENITTGNLKKVLSMGMLFNTTQKANEGVGAYTENRLRQRKIDQGMTFAKYGIGLMVNPLLGGVYAGSDLAYRSAMYSIKVQKENRQADFYKRLSGNNSFSGSRYRGDYV
jgi:hypothetical protein